jgi:hypothetical protein
MSKVSTYKVVRDWKKELNILPYDLRSIIFSFFYQPLRYEIVTRINSPSPEDGLLFIRATLYEHLFRLESKHLIEELDIDMGTLETYESPDETVSIRQLQRIIQFHKPFWQKKKENEKVKKTKWNNNGDVAKLFYKTNQVKIISSNRSQVVIPQTLYSSDSPPGDIQAIQNGGLIISLEDGTIIIMR